MNNIYNIVTCGDVDSGKSTLLGRILFNTGNVYNDQIDEVIKASDKYSNSGKIEYGFLFDGLQSEREQQITIDIAHRYFNIKNTRFHLFDAPGHIQYLHNFVIGCTEAECAILMIDSTVGITKQTFVHYNICKDLLVENIIICITKVDISSSNIVIDLENQIKNNFEVSKIFKTSAFDNTETDDLINYLYELSLIKKEYSDFVLLPQRVVYDGSNRVIQGIKYGDLQSDLTIYPLNLKCELDKYDGILSYKLNSDVDVSRGDIITNIQLAKSNKLSGRFIKFTETLSNNLIFKYGTGLYIVKELSENKLLLNNEINYTAISKNKQLGYGVVVDIETKLNVGLFIINSNIIIPKCYWFTGLSGSGKTTLAKLFINTHSIKPILLDGDDLRCGLNADLDLSVSGRTENIRRMLSYLNC